MKIAVSAMGYDLDSPFSPMFGRCPVYIIVETDAMTFHAVSNQAASASGGAGIQTAQEVVRHEVKGVITGNIGPNAHRVLVSAGVPVFIWVGGTVRQAVEAYRAGQLNSAESPTEPAHGGMGMMRGMGIGRGKKVPAAYGFGAAAPAQPLSEPSAPATQPSSESNDVASLKSEIAELRDRLGKLTDQIEGRGGE